jgi:hypothetical protein
MKVWTKHFTDEQWNSLDHKKSCKMFDFEAYSQSYRPWQVLARLVFVLGSLCLVDLAHYTPPYSSVSVHPQTFVLYSAGFRTWFPSAQQNASDVFQGPSQTRRTPGFLCASLKDPGWYVWFPWVQSSLVDHRCRSLGAVLFHRCENVQFALRLLFGLWTEIGRIFNQFKGLHWFQCMKLSYDDDFCPL